MTTYKCCKCGAINKVQEEDVKKDAILASREGVQENDLIFDMKDQEEYVKIYSDDNDTGKWD